MDKNKPIIEKYTVPNHSDDLNQRIIMDARKTPQKTSLPDRLKAWLTTAETPALSYGFASVLVVGLLIGGIFYNTPNITTPNDTSAITLADLFDEDDSLLIL